jgi:hypothetical protein
VLVSGWQHDVVAEQTLPRNRVGRNVLQCYDRAAFTADLDIRVVEHVVSTVQRW